ncbi:MAG TPA: GNAT family N-acetyltransferase [Cytophagales bacterium]|jgi:GNAT superfamily N-acetyltransferase|nr:GNAT family N-acetyltransferase [Cytophagales bacterium]
MDEIIIRSATKEDLNTLLQFEQGIVEAERPFDPTLASGVIHYYDLEALIDSPEAEVVVAELSNKVIASGYARIEKSKNYLAHSHHAYLGFMYVLPKHRGKGVNKKIIDALKDWSKKKQINEIRLEVYHENESAIRAYQKLGFTPNLVEMRMNLE